MLGLGRVKTGPMEVLNLQNKAKIRNCTLRFLGNSAFIRDPQSDSEQYFVYTVLLEIYNLCFLNSASLSLLM